MLSLFLINMQAQYLFTTVVMFSSVWFVGWVIAKAIIRSREEERYSFMLQQLKELIEKENGEVTLAALVLKSGLPVAIVRDFLTKIAFEFEAEIQHDERGREVYYFEV